MSKAPQDSGAAVAEAVPAQPASSLPVTTWKTPKNTLLYVIKAVRALEVTWLDLSRDI